MSIVRVSIQPQVLQWARRRSGFTTEALRKRFPKFELWEKGLAQPTFKQLEKLASTLHIPLGFFFLQSPPEEHLPIPDYRTNTVSEYTTPSLELLHTIYQCQQRQEWYRFHVLSQKGISLSFVGTASLSSPPEVVANDIRNQLHLDIHHRKRMTSWSTALLDFIDQVEKTGILVMMNSVVGNNNHRPLNPNEFRGFALVDDIAPLIFINGADTIAAKLFTLAHELAHIWLGQSGISNPQLNKTPNVKIERWCNQVAAEILVPLTAIKKEYNPHNSINDEINRLAHLFKVSTIVILIRLYDEKMISKKTFKNIYQRELRKWQSFKQHKKQHRGGNFYYNLSRKVSKRFALALIHSTLEGHTLYRDAYNLLGISKFKTFQRFAQTLGLE